MYLRGHFFLLYKGASTSNPSICRGILPQEQAVYIKCPLTNCSTDSPTREALDGSSQIWATGPPTWVNEGRPTGPAGTPEGNYINRRASSEISYPYRPTPIDVDLQQHSLSTSLPFNITSSSVSNRNIDTHQGLAPIEEDEMPYDLFGNFIMNPEAPVFVPRQPRMLPLSWRTVWGEYLTNLIAMAARDLRDLMHEGVTEPEGDQSPGKKPYFSIILLSFLRVYYVSWASTPFLPLHMLLYAFLTPFLTGFFPLVRVQSISKTHFLSEKSVIPPASSPPNTHFQRHLTSNSLTNTNRSPPKHAKRVPTNPTSAPLRRRPRHVLRPNHRHVHRRRSPPRVPSPPRRHLTITARPPKRLPHQTTLPPRRRRPTAHPTQERIQRAHGRFREEWPDRALSYCSSGATGISSAGDACDV